MSATISPLESDICTSLRAFIQAVLGSTVEVVRGIGNRVPMPSGAFVLMTPLFQSPLEWPLQSFDASDNSPTSLALMQPMRMEVQLDFYGPTSSAWASLIQALWHTEYACDQLGSTCQPLGIPDIRMIPVVAGEQQYIERWSLTAAVQYNPVTSTPQTFADDLAVSLVDVEEAFPVGTVDTDVTVDSLGTVDESQGVYR